MKHCPNSCFREATTLAELATQVAGLFQLAGICIAQVYTDESQSRESSELFISSQALEPYRSEVERLVYDIPRAEEDMTGTIGGEPEMLCYRGGRYLSDKSRYIVVLLFCSPDCIGALTDKLSQDSELVGVLLNRVLSTAFVNERMTADLRQLRIIQRQQLVWFDCLEWLQQVKAADDSFYKEVLECTARLCEADAGAVYIPGEDGEHHWISRRLSLSQVNAINRLCPDKDLFALDHPLSVNDLVSHTNSDQSDAEGKINNLLAIPFKTERDAKGYLFLANQSQERTFGAMDETYVAQILELAFANIEKYGLLGEVNNSNQKLKREQIEQEKLINALQTTQSQLLQSEKMASIGQLAAGVAHEINNPIGYVNSNLNTLGKYTEEIMQVVDKIETVCKRQGNEGLKQSVDHILKEHDIGYLRDDLFELQQESIEGIERVKRIVHDLRDFSHVSDEAMQFIDLHKGIRSTLNIVHNEIKNKAGVETEFGDLPLVECVASQINQIFMNLLVNAGHAIESKGLITIRTWCEDDRVKISIADSGCGIAPENVDRLFEPFFTTKPVGQGTGLGLSLSYSIIQKHHGEIEVESEPGKGTTFTVILPIKQTTENEVGLNGPSEYSI